MEGDAEEEEQQLRTTLHHDDKEKLRRKLALLQREYVRTAQRLQRAERLEVTRGHVRSSIARDDQREPEATANGGGGEPAPGLDQPQGTGGSSAADSDDFRRSRATGFLRTPDPRPSPSLRLRSRRSRLRWERRSGEERPGRRGVEGEEEEKTGASGAEVGNERRTPSPLARAHADPGPAEGKETQREDQETGWGQKTEDGEDGGGRREKRLREDDENAAGAGDGEKRRSVETKEEKSGAEEEGRSLLDSCTLVEGLLFPAEYYVRTTRRMTLSQSQRDVQAVVLSQLSAGRRRRSRGARADSSSSSPATPREAASGAVGGASRPSGGGRRRGGGGRGRAPPPHYSSSSSSSLPLGDGDPTTRLSPGEPVSMATRRGAASGDPEKVYPIFVKSGGTPSTRTSGGPSAWRSLLLPSPPPARPSPSPSPSPGALFGGLPKFDVHLDFHLPDDQFASLKLRKLRQGGGAPGVERFTRPACDARGGGGGDGADPVEPLPLPLSLTPTIVDSQRPAAAETVERQPDPTEPVLSVGPRAAEINGPGSGRQTGGAVVPPVGGQGSPNPREGHVKPPPSDWPRQETPNQRGAHSQLLMSPPPASAPMATQHPPPSPALPSLGFTPGPSPLSSSPSAPTLTLPPPHSPSTRARSPPPLSPRPAPPPCWGPAGGRRVTTLKAPAGGRLVDACCLPGPSGGLCVAAAGKWAVCLWSQSPASDWLLTHTWTFDDPVINVFPVPDAAGLMFLTLGQLEIREVRTLSCSSLRDAPLCRGVVQAAVGVSGSRVVTSSPSAGSSALQVFAVSDDGSTPSSRPLASPGVCVGVLAPVDGLPDALIGTDEGGRVFIWNLRTGRLLRTVVLGDGLSHTSCLGGFSRRGALLVLLQHQPLGSLEEEEEEEEEERKKTALFSLVAVNPLSGKSVAGARLYPPTGWSGRLCEADVSGAGVVGLSQSGCVCVWGLGRPGAPAMVRAPEGEGWQLARWGGRDTLVTGHHNGDVTLHHCG